MNGPSESWPATGLQCLIACILALSAAPTAAGEAEFPSKPIVIELAYPPGGPADESIRSAAVVLARSLKQQLVIENSPGANGSIAAMNVLRGPADGYTLLGTTGTDFIVAPHIIPSAKYDPKAFHLIGQVGVADFLLVSSSKHNFANVNALIAYAQNEKNPKLTIAHWGAGSAPQIVGAEFQHGAGVRFLEVPYKGASPAIASVLGGHIDLTFVPLGSATRGLVASGRLRPIGLAAAKRNDAFPDVPTIDESAALKGGFEHSVWSAIFAPPGTPEPVIKILSAAMNDWVGSEENEARVKANAARMLMPTTPDKEAALLAAEIAKLDGAVERPLSQ